MLSSALEQQPHWEGARGIAALGRCSGTWVWSSVLPWDGFVGERAEAAPHRRCWGGGAGGAAASCHLVPGTVQGPGGEGVAKTEKVSPCPRRAPSPERSRKLAEGQHQEGQSRSSGTESREGGAPHVGKGVHGWEPGAEEKPALGEARAEGPGRGHKTGKAQWALGTPRKVAGVAGMQRAERVGTMGAGGEGLGDLRGRSCCVRSRLGRGQRGQQEDQGRGGAAGAGADTPDLAYGVRADDVNDVNPHRLRVSLLAGSPPAASAPHPTPSLHAAAWGLLHCLTSWHPARGPKSPWPS